jgi:hypothetical protein
LPDFWRFIALLTLVSIAEPAKAGSSAPMIADAEVAAAMVYNFAKFVEWPSAADSSPFVVGVTGAEALEAALRRAVKGRTVNGQPIAVRRVVGSRDLPACRILFIGSRAEDWIELAHGAPILTVSDLPAFSEIGGMIGLVLIDRKIQFEINLAAARRAGLAMSSQLLGLAVNVRGRK